MKKTYFITGIGTEIGKTISSAVLVEKLNADYWKPIQAGDLDNSDTLKVKSLISNEVSKFHTEAFRLTQPFSPHYAAELDGVEINMNQITIPKTENNLIIEGAGGLMVPINQKDLMIDLIQKLNVEVILISKNYLGSINHTLLSIEALKTRNIPIKGIIFNGIKTEASESIILERTKLKYLGRISEMEIVNKSTIKNAVNLLEID
jgi:dethiobiotin synthetase